MLLTDYKGIRFAVSKKPYDFRAALGEDHFRKDTENFLNKLGVTAKAVYYMNQTHSDHVAIIDEDSGEDYFGYRIVADTDALITDKKHVVLVTRISDCTPVLLYDPVTGTMASIHAGWRSTVQKLPAKALIAMKKHYGTNPKDVLAFIGPCIGRESFQVGKEVSALWGEAFDFARDVISPDDDAHDLIDMKKPTPACFKRPVFWRKTSKSIPPTPLPIPATTPTVEMRRISEAMRYFPFSFKKGLTFFLHPRILIKNSIAGV